jgi:hypothetical protein
MIRTDGTKVTTLRHPSWKTEFYRLWVALRTDPMVILLFPMFFASNWFYTWRELCPFQACQAYSSTEFSEYNSALFNIRARSLNNVVYWTAQIFGSIAIGLLLDQKRIRRRLRAFLGWAVLFCMVFAVHIWAFFYQRSVVCFR